MSGSAKRSIISVCLNISSTHCKTRSDFYFRTPVGSTFTLLASPGLRLHGMLSTKQKSWRGNICPC